MSPPRAAGRDGSRGFTLVECLVALALLGLVLTMSFHVLVRHRRYLERMEARLTALGAAEVELETLLAAPFAELAPRTNAPPLTRSDELGRLPQARMSHSIYPTDRPTLRRVRVEVSWKLEGGGPPVVLEALAYGGAVRRASGKERR